MFLVARLAARAAMVVAASVAAVAAAEPVSPPTNAGWLATVSAGLREGEYHLSPKEHAEGWTAPNREKGLRGWWHGGALEVTPRIDSNAWRFTYSLASVGRAGAPRAAGVSDVIFERVHEGRIEWRRDGLVESYVNDARGIEQGFTLETRPEGEARDEVVIEGWISGLLALPADDGSSVLLRTAAGDDAMRIRDLVVRDANGVALESCMSVATGALQIRFDDRDAAYPVSVDPLLTSPSWTAEGDQASAVFGLAVATAGDVNGDGYSDVIVGAAEYDNGEANEGRAFAYLGSASGLSTTPAWTAESDQDSAELGNSVATAGDINGDGYSDVIVGVSHYDHGEPQEGAARVYNGSAQGLGLTPSWTVEGDRSGARFGHSVATAGDVNGDGYSDVIVGAHLYDDGQQAEGRAFVYNGSAMGLSTTPSWTVEGDQQDAFLGTSVATAGDVNGDGFSDVIVGANGYSNGQPSEGRAFVYHGSVTGLAQGASWIADGDQASAAFGISVATAGDVDGDGYSDVIVGALGYNNGQADEGRAFVYHGSESGLSTSADWMVEGDQAGAFFGNSVATAGDVNGDGYADVIVGAYWYDNGERDEGRAFVYHGSAGGLATTPAWTAESDQPDAALGYSVAMAGDVNGDGYSDVIVGAHLYDDGETDEGAAFVYNGSPSGLATTAGWTAESDSAGAEFGTCVATAGDVNSDGYSDVIVGARTFDHGEAWEGGAFAYLGSVSGLSTTAAWMAEGDQADAFFGASVGTAGDVNGDGYSDIIVGAPILDPGQGGQGGNRDQGRVYVYLGSALGISTPAAWTAEGDQIIENFGYSVATAGDVNGDGYSDVIVGAIAYEDGQSQEGGAFVYHGSASGLSATAAWTAESDQAFAHFGQRVATAGDVNGDGYSDVIVGAPGYSNGQQFEGRAFVYSGSANGLATTPAWTAEGDQGDAGFGASVATAGDVNGDGYSDVIVGAEGYDNGQGYAGRAFVYHGAASGLSSSADWMVGGNQFVARYGRSVATAGDVNGDGYSDVIVGADLYDNGQTDEGRAFVYNGSAGGLATTPAWTAESDQPDAGLGNSVATAGDVNGDGYSDIIVGASLFDNGEVDEGRAFLYYGNDGDGLDRIPRQARADGSAPIDLLGKTLTADGFRLRANGRTPFGRDFVRLEWEVQPLGTPLDGTSIQTSSWFDTGAPGANGSVVALDELHASLPANGPYHWHLRLRSRFPFPWQSHWMGMPYNCLTETDLRSDGSNADPSCNAGADVTQSCDGVQLDGSASDADGDALTFHWSAACGATFSPSADVEDPVVTFGASCGVSCDLTLNVDDGNGGTCSDVVHIGIDDTTPPAIMPDADGSRCVWSPNHRWICFDQSDFAPGLIDDCAGPVTWRFDGCASDQPSDGQGDGHTDPDCRVSADGTGFCVRAERQGGVPSGRTYGVTIVATDACGNVSAPAVAATIRVLHDRREQRDCVNARRGGRRQPGNP